ncbi:MAG: cation diffusion facilitator family transporter [Bacillota bacterium]
MYTYKRGIVCQKVVFCTLLANIILVLLKGLAGCQAGSDALMADAFHSGGDVLASLAILLCFRVASRPPDRCHHFGHGKVEFLATALVSLLLLYIAYELVMTTMGKIRGMEIISVPGSLALWVSLLCLLLKEAMYRFTVYFGRKMGSPALIADAWHHRSDAIFLGGVFIGTGAARAGYPLMDPLVGQGIAVLIGIMAVRLARQALQGLLDSAPDANRISDVASIIEKVGGVKEIHRLRGRYSGSVIFMEAKVGVAAELSVLEGHAIARDIKEAIQEKIPEIADITVHINPVKQHNINVPAGDNATLYRS